MAPIRSTQVPGTVRPIGHDSPAIVHEGLVYVSGQVPAGLEDALQMPIFISRIEDWSAINATYARIIGNARPTRAIVPVAPLPDGAGIDIMGGAAVAAANQPPRRTR